MKSVDNLEIQKEKNSVIVSVNPKIFPLNVIFSAAYAFMDKAYIIIDGDPNEEILVQLKSKEENPRLDKLGREFNNELINYSFFLEEWKKNKNLRDMIFDKILKSKPK